jgi:acetyl esterase/lipase
MTHKRCLPILFLLHLACDADRPGIVDAGAPDGGPWVSDSAGTVDAAPGDPAGDTAAGPDASCAPVAARRTLDIAYATMAGVAPELLSLDIASPARPDGCKLAPVVVWTHGGGWASGDKGNNMLDKVALFNGAGYVLVSINYRLSPDPPSGDPQRIKYPVHPEDVARALDWIVDNIESHGGDPSRLALLGHSAGAHLVALVSTDEGFLAAHGRQLTLVRCTGSLDTEGYDIPTHLKTATVTSQALYQNAFGSDPAIWAQASPTNHIAPGKGIPPFIFASRGTAARQAQLKAFADKLEQVGVKTTIIDAVTLSHAEVNAHIGAPGDTIMTPPLMAFLKSCLGG